VPVGGAADRFALAVGNALLGNAPDAAALEVALAGPTLRADAAVACVLYGAPFETHTDRRPLSAGTTFTLEPGETLHVGGTPRGARAYLCVRGGLHTPVVLGSRSSLEPLPAGTTLPCAPGRVRGRSVQVPPLEEEGGDEGVVTLRVLDGPQAGWFPGGGLSPGASFTVSAASDRMGLRLSGEPLAVPAREMVSEPVCPGSVQVTRDGQCVVLGVDGQTVGGYPKVAQVIMADLDRLGQLRPGEVVALRRVDLAEAEALRRRRREYLARWVRRLHTAAGLLP
jgi:antagonist of KipI